MHCFRKRIFDYFSTFLSNWISFDKSLMIRLQVEPGDKVSFMQLLNYKHWFRAIRGEKLSEQFDRKDVLLTRLSGDT